ncbi:major facilitator superfamily domain-containing protein [Neurospora hispaniola]|uniref:Major facilitator superfamily domain-containing protein n=1 Tax=Neurospora hispaniola TaxID=588809 RepID=A0AAJ0IDX2_9PEZI|nr:major facilitator superfamily domain-containing protein [Neurospora hispaniola]
MDPPEDTDTNDTPTEQTTLLPQDAPSFQDQKPSSSALWPTLVTVASLTLLFTMGVQITTAPSLAILQGIICKKYYEKGIIDSLSLGKGLPTSFEGLPTNFEDDKCKVGPVQSEVAEVNAWKDVFEILPAVALAIPWGILTDRIGRKKVLLLALLGCLLNEAWVRLVYYFPNFFPIRAVWFGGLFQLLGSGSTTFTSIVYVLIADVCPAEQRSTFFSYLLAASIVSRFLFVPIGGALIAYDDAWLAMWIGLLVQVVGYVVAVVFVEETLPASSDIDSLEIGVGELVMGAEGEEENSGSSAEETITKHKKTVMQLVEEYVEKTKEAGTWTCKNPKAVLLLLCFWLYYMGEQAEQLLMIQYASKRLGWSLGKASLLPSLGALTNLLTLTLLLPSLSTFFSHSSPYPWARMGEEAKDALLSRTFATLLTLGCLFISLPISNFGFLASGEVLYSAGAALSVPLRSLITNLVDARHRATLYTVISVVTYAATSAGRPVAAELFGVGLRLGEGPGKGDGDGMRWMGLPFLVAGGMFAVCLGVVTLVGFGKRRGEMIHMGREEEERVEGERYRD